ncbi:unnamed protein product, partial [Enterobius vermicularis]|uniref:ZT_dimer domain-containing protein n=1 Tax=Enterobius vermicularis TaxID=51028 RepID=A0A0N4UUW9_ENTVE
SVTIVKKQLDLTAKQTSLLRVGKLGYYKYQNQLLDQKHKTDSRLASASFILNILLLFANAAASVISGSLSVISAFIDSAMDSTSGLLIYMSIWAIKNTNSFNYPRGRSRLELVAVLACSIIMGVANIMMIIQSVESIVNKTVHPDANLPTILILVSGCFCKVVLMSACYRHGTPSSRNSFAKSLVYTYVGDHYWAYADPLGAICVCSFIAFSWFYNAIDNIPMMVGKRAEQENLSRIIRLCMEHDSNIKCLDHVMVYHTGAKTIVEIHAVLDERLPLKTTHDIIESLTKKVSALPFVERAFVHSDYCCDYDWLS